MTARKPRSKARKAYSSATVRAAHRRVLRMVVDVIAGLDSHEKYILRAWSPGAGVVTLDEVRTHAKAALALRELPVVRKRAKAK